MSWNIKTPGDYINGPLTVVGVSQFNNTVGIGVAPSVFGGGRSALQLGSPAQIVSANLTMELGSNWYHDGTNYRYTNTNPAALYSPSNGSHVWYSAVSGSSGAIVAWSTLATLNTTGLGLGTTPTQRLTVSGNISLTNSAATSIGLTNATSGLTYTLFSASPAGNGFTGFGIYDGSAYIMRTNQQGDFGVGVLPDNNKSACLQLKSGVSFPAAQVTSTDANTLDDYEEGTWTATLKGSTADPTTPVTATGRYTKIGRQVHIQLLIAGVNTTGASGVVQITGVPFAPGEISFGVLQSEFGITFTGTLGCYISASATTIIASASASSGGRTDGTHNAGTNRWFWYNITYSV